MYKVILVDDHYIVRQGLEFLLSTVDDLEIVQGFSNGQDFINYMKTEDRPDLILLDDEHVISAITKGADGYEMKDVEPQQLIRTIHRVLNGEKIIHPEAQQVIDAMSQKPHYTNKLSKRETEVLKEMVKGKTNREIAETLFVSEKTVKTHVSHIFSKLQVTDRTQAAIYAIENKLI